MEIFVMGRKDKIVSSENNASPLGAMMRLARQEKGLTLTEMANFLSYTKSHLSAVENGISRPSKQLVEAYEQQLGLDLGTLDEVLFGSEPRPYPLKERSRDRDSIDTLGLLERGREGQHLLPFRQSSPDSNLLDWGQAPDIQDFYGRESELTTLEQWIEEDSCRVIAVCGIGGVGKTTLSTVLARRVAVNFDYVLWRSLRDVPSLETILRDCISLFSNRKHQDIPEHLDNQISLLIEYLQRKRCLILLDNFDSVLVRSETDQDVVSYADYAKFLERLGEVQHRSCLIITSREKPEEVAHLEGIMPVRIYTLSGIKSSEVQRILKGKGLFGKEDAWDDLTLRYSGNPLALKLISTTIHDVFEGDITAFLEEGGTVVEDIEKLLDEQFDPLSEGEREVLFWLAIEREAVSLKDLREDYVHLDSNKRLMEELWALRRKSLVESNGAKQFYLQPVIMEFVTEKFVEQVYKEIETGEYHLFERYPFIKAQAKDYLKNGQVRFILQPLTRRLINKLGREGYEKKLKDILVWLRENRRHIPGYMAGNILNMLIELGCNLRGYDFSHLVVWQAYLQGVALPEVNFSHASLTKCIFTDTFGSILSVALSPNGEMLAAGTANDEVRLWQVATATPLQNIQGHTNRVRAVAFNLEGNTIVSGSDDQSVRLWDAKTGQCLRTLYGHTNRVRAVAFNADGNTIISGSDDGTVRLWDVEKSRSRVLQGHTGQVYAVAFSPDGKTLVSGSEDQAVQFWDVETGQCQQTLTEHGNRVRTVAFTSDGQRVVSGSDDRTVRLWDVESYQCLSIMEGHTNRVRSVAFSTDGEAVVSGSDDQTVRLWNSRTGQCLKMLQGHTIRIYSIAFNADGKKIISGSDDKMLRLWDVETQQCVKTLQGHAGRIYSIDFSSDGKTVVSGSDDQTVRIWDIETGQYKTLQGHTNWVRSVSFSPDGSMVASGSQDGSILLWDVKTGQRIGNLVGHLNWVRAVRFSPDGKTVVSGSDDQRIHLWDVKTLEPLNTFSGHTKGVRAVCFSPDGKLVASGSDDQTIRLWEVKTGRVFKIFEEQHSYWVLTLAFNHEGTILASGSEDQTIRLWDISSGQCLHVLSGHTNGVYSVCFSPNENLLASGSNDGMIKLWDVQTEECLKTLRNDRPYEQMDVTDVRGLTLAQEAMLRALGAVEK
jgi:WD40 repeat protein/transcriptional regulator with XRE-family HTH domain